MVEKSLLAGIGTCAAHSVPTKATAGVLGLLSELLDAVGRELDDVLLAFQLVSKWVASPIVFGYQSCPTRRSFSSLFHYGSYFVLLAFMTSATARYFCMVVSFVAFGF